MISITKNIIWLNFIAVMLEQGEAEFTMPTCERIYCKEPNWDSDMQVICTDQYWHGSECTASCLPWYRLKGSSNATCWGDGSYPVGEWLHQNMKWQVACLPTSCDAEAGLVRIHPDVYADDGIEVFCENSQHVDGRWIVIQRRINGSVDFYRTYDEYLNGFGNKNGEFWFGLEYIHQLTAAVEYDLLIELEDFDGNKAYETYSKFYLGDSSTKYTLHVENPQGTAGDALITHLQWANGQKFTTHDSDNDKMDDSNCAVKYHGAWWYRRCHNSNLNGRYYNSSVLTAEGITWWEWKNEFITLKSATMKIRKK